MKRRVFCAWNYGLKSDEKMIRQSFIDFIFSTNTDGSGKAASYVSALDMLGPILTKHYPNPIIGGSMWHGFSLADIFRASHISPWAEAEKNRLNSENGLCLSAACFVDLKKFIVTKTMWRTVENVAA